MNDHIETLREMFAVCANERRMKEAYAIDAAIRALESLRGGGEVDWRGHYVEQTAMRYMDAGLKRREALLSAEKDAKALDSMTRTIRLATPELPEGERGEEVWWREPPPGTRFLSEVEVRFDGVNTHGWSREIVKTSQPAAVQQEKANICLFDATNPCDGTCGECHHLAAAPRPQYPEKFERNGSETTDAADLLMPRVERAAREFDSAGMKEDASLLRGLAERYGVAATSQPAAVQGWGNHLAAIRSLVSPLQYDTICEVFREQDAIAAAPQPQGYPDEAAKARMIHDFPKLMDFFTKWAFGPKLAPSCLVCGVSTQGREIGIRHMELPSIVVCMQCRNLATATPPASGGAVGCSNCWGDKWMKDGAPCPACNRNGRGGHAHYTPSPTSARELPERPSAEWYRRKVMEGDDVEAMAGPAPTFFVCSNLSERHRMPFDPSGHCPFCRNDGLGNWSCTPEGERDGS